MPKTSLPVVQAVPGSVWLADAAEEMAVCCRQAAEHNGDAERRDRSNRMVAESWSARLEQMSALAEDSLPPRKRIPDKLTCGPSEHVALAT